MSVGSEPEWETWLSAWEQHLDDLVAWVDGPADVATLPEPPTTPRPDGVLPAILAVRARRAGAVRAQLEARITVQLSATRRWAATPDAPARRFYSDL